MPGDPSLGNPLRRRGLGRSVGRVIRGRSAGAPGATPRRSKRALAVVIALGVAGTTMAALALRRADEDRVERAVEQQTTVVAQVVSAEIRRYSTSLIDLAAAAGAQSDLQASEFTAITAPVDRERLPGATGVSFIVPATTGQMPGVQAFWRAHGASGLTFVPAPGRTDHMFLVLNRPIDGAPVRAGVDLTASGEAAAALRVARDSHGVATSRTYRLLKDAALPPAQQQLSFVLAAPVYATSPAAPDNGRFRGWVIMGLRAGNFLHEVISVVARDTVIVDLFDPNSGGSAPVASWEPAAAADTSHAGREVVIPVPQQQWVLRVRPTVRLLPASDRHLDVIAWLVGTVITCLLAMLTITLLTSRDRALRRVDIATAALRDDILRREAVEHQLRRRETELVGFAGVVAHDLRSPLARIIGYADFLRDEAAPLLAPVHQDFLERLYVGAERMRSLIDDLLDYATADNRELHRTDVDLHALVEDIVRERVPGPQPTVIIGGLPVVPGDPTLLRQVLDNLIGNALKYTPPGAEPYVEVVGRPAIRGGWRIEVADHGIGIPEDQRATVFTAFTRAGGSEGYPGTGLGLAIVHRIVERHGGRTGVDPNPGGGSRFWFTLPPCHPADLDRPCADRAPGDRNAGPRAGLPA
jgi:signal transduction histidine kinase